MSKCEHAIGTAVEDYETTLIFVGTSGLMKYQEFQGWKYCPYCGIGVDKLVAEMEQSIIENEDAWEKKYGHRLSEKK